MIEKQKNEVCKYQDSPYPFKEESLSDRESDEESKEDELRNPSSSVDMVH